MRLDRAAVVRRACEVFAARPWQRAEAVVVRSPGRVNLIGDHIDYSGGSVLPLALDLGTTAVLLPRADRVVRGWSETYPGIRTADLDALPADGWLRYPLAVVRTAASDGLVAGHGFDLYLAADLPAGAGLSSSASVELATGIGMTALYGWPADVTDWAVRCRRAENEQVGVACGIMDQLAIARGVADHALLVDCATLAVDPVPLPADRCAVLIADSGVPRQLAASAYNDRRAATEHARRILERAAGVPLPALAHAPPQWLDRYGAALDEAGVRRAARHTVTEHRRVLAAAAALRAGDFDTVGGLMRESHASLRDDFAVSVPELDALVDVAARVKGVFGARMTGAGFGGSVVVLTAPRSAGAAAEAIRAGYERAVGRSTTVVAVRAAAGVHVVRP